MSEESNEVKSFWAILELMGHRRLGGLVSDVVMFGTRLCRVDIPAREGTEYVTQYYSPQAIYALTPCSEEAARALAKLAQPGPIHRRELPRPASGTATSTASIDDGVW